MKRFVIILSAVLCVSACIGASQPCAEVQTFLTGECLKSTELTYYVPNSPEQMCGYGNKYSFGFSMDLEYSNECTDNYIWHHYWRHVPSQKMYDAFGKNSASVKKAFEEEFQSLITRLYQEDYPASVQNYSVVTILYNGGISLVANKEFAGVPAGKDLSEIIVRNPNYNTNFGQYPDIPMEYISMPEDGIVFSFPLDGFKVVSEQVTFELNIPVKVVMYLQWLNDKLSNPDAPVPYKEEVLHCHFTSPYCLK